ncbi:hypothetical protein BEWA_007890 [Theileria equi strain WA]|uniref:Uncharacterized protein n=1 Tax=Theileria equi strain WA TaxID=1537102 RepID=L0B0Q5_THEEQ|nr:hypothetical protein BEWA_007890 [Theileria equi strain WA]AFZ81380.1 hypothetical protein BEWA_007890 [Theileria equi strain WA]|eukprot:XP_004831046.1 hypothetical protein BEWA_007890 [Theileria equi strain WA]
MSILVFKTLLKPRYFSISGEPPKELLAPIPAAPTGKIPISQRGNHQHNKRLYDRVYPTTKIPSALVPRYPIDWRNAGRYILTAAIAKLENKRIYRHPQALKFQNSGYCGERCSSVCRHSAYKCLCSWRFSGLYSHIATIDSLLMSYKGSIPTKKPIFSLPYPFAKKNTKKSNKLVFCKDTNTYFIVRKRYRYPVFNAREDFATSIHSSAIPFDSNSDIFDVRR